MLVELLELDPIEVLCEHIGGIVSSRNENDRDFVVLNAFTYIVIADINVLSPLLLYRVRANE